jgi:hypothetical protein
MPLIKYFAENGKLLETRDETLNPNNLEHYIKQNGIEKAEGYIEALKDIKKQFDSFITIHGTTTYRYNSPHKIKRETIKVYEEKEAFLDFEEAFLDFATNHIKNYILSKEKPNLE